LIRILYAWELGAGLGHVSRFVPLARALAERGCAVTWALSDLAPAAALLPPGAATLLQAPRFRGQVTGLPEPQLAYSEVLLRHGYASAEHLSPLLREWRALIAAARPDLIITDHAPTALLAARGLGCARARIGTGFCCPPAATPEAPMMPWMPPDAARSRQSGQQVLDSINGALQAAGAAPLATLAQMHEADEDFVTTYPELDHYPQRSTPRWGAVLGSEGGLAPAWPVVLGPRVFAYLRARQPQTAVLLRTLRRKHYATLVYCPDLTPQARAEFQSPTLRFSDQPLDIVAVSAASDLVICGGGHGTVCAALLAGKPLLLMPEMAEQAITAWNVEALGAGLGLASGQESRVGALLTRLLHEPGFGRAAQQFRAVHAGTAQAQIIDGIAQRCVELATQTPRPGTDT